MEARLRPTICATSFNLSNRFMRTPLAGYRVEVPALTPARHALELRSLSRTSLDRHPGIPRRGSVPAYGVGLHSPIRSEVEVLSSLPLPLPELRAQVVARFAFACLVVPLDILVPPGRSQPLPSPSPLVAFAAVRSIERLPLLGGEALTTLLPPSRASLRRLLLDRRVVHRSVSPPYPAGAEFPGRLHQ